MILRRAGGDADDWLDDGHNPVCGHDLEALHNTAEEQEHAASGEGLTKTPSSTWKMKKYVYEQTSMKAINRIQCNFIKIEIVRLINDFIFLTINRFT